MRLRVVWGLGETMAIFSPARVLVRVDLPTLGRPTFHRWEDGKLVCIRRIETWWEETDPQLPAGVHQEGVVGVVHVLSGQQLLKEQGDKVGGQ